MSSNIIKTYNEALKSHIESQLHTIDENHNYRVNWFTDIEKKAISGQRRIDATDKDVSIVLNPQPSNSYGDGRIQYNLEMKIFATQKEAENVLDALVEYQMGVFSNKWYTDNGTCVNESWYSPTVSENFIDRGTTQGIELTMNGIVDFIPNVIDYDLYIGNNKIKPLDVLESTTYAPMKASSQNDGVAKTINESVANTITLKLLMDSSPFSLTLRSIKERQQDVEYLNPSVVLTFNYIDGHTYSNTYTIDSIVVNKSINTIPTWSVVLSEKKIL